MAEALGLASSIVALVQLSASVYSATSKFYRQAKEAKSKISALATQTRNLSGVLHSLSLLTSAPLFDDVGAAVPDFRDTYIDSCRTTLHNIKRKLEKAEADLDSGSHKRLITRSLKWPFDSQETTDLITELSQHQNILQLALSAETMSHLLQCLANTNSIAKSIDGLHRKVDRKASIDTRAELTARRKEIVQFFLKVNPEQYLQDCRKRRQENTGRWLVERDQTFRDWIDSTGSQIWLSGIPGAGKTILCGTVVEEILQEQTTSTAVAFFFCDYKHTESQKCDNILAALAIQLAKQADSAFELLESYYEELHPHNRMARPPETKDLIRVVQAMTEKYDRVYLAIDGLDECGSNVVEALQALKKVAKCRQVSAAFFSRNEPDIMEELGHTQRIEIAAHTEDLELYVLAQMEARKKLGNLAVRSPELHEHIRRTLVGGANGMFRWVACQLDYLDTLPSDGRRRKALTELPPTLFETYDRILDRIMQGDERDQELCRKALHWIGLGYENIDPLALCEAISIPDGQDLIDEELVDPDWISRSCSSLIRLAGQEFGCPHFQFAHFTVKEYLRIIKAGSKRSLFRFSENVAIQELLGCALRFLTFPVFDRKPMIASSEIQRLAERNEQHPFYPVAADYMIMCPSGQYRPDSDFKLGEELSLLLENDKMMQYAKTLFSPDKTGIFLSWVLQVVWSWPDETPGEVDFFDILGLILAPEFTPLHIAAILAVPSICTHLIDNQVNLNVCCRIGTPMHGLLAGLGLLNPRRSFFEYDLHRHYRFSEKPGHYDQARICLEVFLEHGADTSIRWNSTTVLEMAVISPYNAGGWIKPLIVPSTTVSEECADFVKTQLDGFVCDESILDAIVSLGSTTEPENGWARLASRIQAIRMQEEYYEQGNVPPDLEARILDEDFADSIRVSLSQGLTDSLKAFLQDPRFRAETWTIHDGDYAYPILHFAIKKRCLKSVKLLLEAGCDPKVVDEYNGWTTLHQCAVDDTDDAAIMELLLELGMVDSVVDQLGMTCWHLAAEDGNAPALRLLIDKGSDKEQSLATISHEGRTPLASAILEGEIESALLLLKQCSAKQAFQSDHSLLDAAASIGSVDLFLQLHEKLDEAGVTEAINTSNPLGNISMTCSTHLLDHLLKSWGAGRNANSNVLTRYLLDANHAFFNTPDNYPSRCSMDHIIRRLLPPEHVFGDHRKTQMHFWETFCEKVVPFFTNASDCDHTQFQCRTDLIGMIFGILIDIGLLNSYERNSHLPAYRILFQALLNRGDRLNCSWIAPSVSKVIQSDRLSKGAVKEAVSIELLSCAVQQDNIELVRELVDHGVDVHVAHGHLSPLERVCRSCDQQMFQIILSHSDKTLINRTGSQGKTLLHWVVAGSAPGYLEKIEKLLQLGADIESKVEDTEADTALTLASRTHRQDIVALLVSKGADSLHRARDGWTLLHAAADTGDLRYIQPLISAKTPSSFWLGVCEFPLIQLDNEPHICENTSVLHIAARRGRANVLRCLIQNELPFDVNAVTGHPWMTPLQVASFSGHLDVVEILTSSKANVNARDASGILAIDQAVWCGHLEIVKLLLKSGSEKPTQSFGGYVAEVMSTEIEWEEAEDSRTMDQFYFEIAIKNGDLDRCKWFVANGQSINAELLTRSFTPLVRAVVEGQEVIVDWLVSNGVEVTGTDLKTFHPSLRNIMALSTHHLTSVRSLAGVMSLSLSQNTSWYRSILGPLHVAILDNKLEALEMMLEHIRENDHAYRKIIETEIVLFPANKEWSNQSALSILVNDFNQEAAFFDGSPWTQAMPAGSPLHWAIRKNDVAAAKLLLQNGADLNQGDASGRTPMHLAISSLYSTTLLTELLRAGATLGEPSRSRINAMRLAIGRGDLEVVELLAEADPETLKSVDQSTADSLLARAGSVDVLQYLISQGASFFKVTDFRDSAVAAHIWRPSSLRAFIFNSGLASLSAEEPLLFAFTQAAFEGNFQAIRMLRRALSRDLFESLVNGTTCGIGSPFCVAASVNAVVVVKGLIAMGADLDIEGCRHGSPLMAACAWGCLDVVRWLVRSGAILCYVNGDGLLRSAVSLSSRHEKVMRWLLVDRHMEQLKLEHQHSQHTSQQRVWSGPRLFKLALPAPMHRDFGESRLGHLRRLQKWKERLLGATLAESRKNSGLDFDAELEAESKKSDAQCAHRQLLRSLGEDW